MRGTLLSTWEFAWKEIWVLVQSEPDEANFAVIELLAGCEFPDDFEPHPDLFAALYQEAVKALRPEVRQTMGYGQIAVNQDSAVRLFQELESPQFDSEASLVELYEGAFEVLSEYDSLLSRRFLVLLRAFAGKYNLRYEVEADGSLTPTIPGCFASLFEELSSVCQALPDTPRFLDDLGRAYKVLKQDRSDSQVRTYLSRLINLFESILGNHPDARGGTLGSASEGLRSWPHKAVQQSLAKIYGFTSDYPGIRHAGSSQARLRDLDMRDALAVTIILSGYAPYLIDQLDCETVYLPLRKRASGDGPEATDQPDGGA